jgi:hypothetical protein
MKIRLTWPLCAVLLLAAICAFAYSCRVKEAFKAEMHEMAKPAAPKPAAPKPVAPTMSAIVPVKPTVSSIPTKRSTPNSVIIVNTQAETITLPGQPPIKYSSFSCNNTGACTYVLQNGQMLVAKVTSSKIL